MPYAKQVLTGDPGEHRHGPPRARSFLNGNHRGDSLAHRGGPGRHQTGPSWPGELRPGAEAWWRRNWLSCLAVSKTPVREALKTLAGRGPGHDEARTGEATVRAIDPAERRAAIYDLRPAAGTGGGPPARSPAARRESWAPARASPVQASPVPGPAPVQASPVQASTVQAGWASAHAALQALGPAATDQAQRSLANREFFTRALYLACGKQPAGQDPWTTCAIRPAPGVRALSWEAGPVVGSRRRPSIRPSWAAARRGAATEAAALPPAAHIAGFRGPAFPDACPPPGLWRPATEMELPMSIDPAVTDELPGRPWRPLAAVPGDPVRTRRRPPTGTLPRAG